ncbi:DUF6612 family protein [Salirhabdus euzebyi]|nr:DUF6612 family protein [Salirhabdus euzebyi]
MKKYAVLVLLLFTVILSACGGGAEKLDAKEVLTQSAEAVDTLDSYSINMVMNMDMMDMENTMDISGDITHSPDTMYLMMSMGMLGMSMDFETYVNQDEAYMSMFGEWFIMDKEELGIESFDQLNKEEAEKLIPFSDQFEMTEDGNMYVLSLSGEGEEYSELVEELVQSSMGELPTDPAMEPMIQSINVNSLDLEVRIDKDTFIQMSQQISADLEIVEEETTTPMQLEAQFDISNVNSVEPIVIPDEVKDTAVEDFMGDADSLGFPEEMTIEEIQEMVDYTIPQVRNLPEDYSLIESLYDETMDMVMLSYEKDYENGFMLSTYRSEDEYEPFDETMEGEPVTIQGTEGLLYDMEGFYVLTWEHNGLFLELMGGGPEITRDQFVEFAQSVE